MNLSLIMSCAIIILALIILPLIVSYKAEKERKEDIRTQFPGCTANCHTKERRAHPHVSVSLVSSTLTYLRCVSAICMSHRFSTAWSDLGSISGSGTAALCAMALLSCLTRFPPTTLPPPSSICFLTRLALGRSLVALRFAAVPSTLSHTASSVSKLAARTFSVSRLEMRGGEVGVEGSAITLASICCLILNNSP